MQRYLPIIFLTFVNVIGFGILIPVLSEISTNMAPQSWSSFIFGVLISSYALCQFLAAPVLGSLSDRYGRRPLLLISQVGTVFSWIIFAASYFIDIEHKVGDFSLALIVIATARIVDGITGGNIAVAQAWVADMTSPKDRSTVFGYLGVVFGLGFLLGPALGGLSFDVGGLGYFSTAICALSISIITLFLMWLRLPESLPVQKRNKKLTFSLRQELNIVHQINSFRTNRVVYNVLLLRVAFALVFSSYTTLFTVMLAHDFDFTTSQIGLAISAVGIFSIFNQGLIIPRLTRVYEDLQLLMVGVFIVIIGLFAVTFVSPEIMTWTPGKDDNLLLFSIVAYIINLGISIAQPTFKGVLTKQVKIYQQGKITGLDESLLSLGQGVTPIMAGGLYALWGSYTFLAYFLVLAAAYWWLRGRLDRERVLSKERLKNENMVN